jgi:hypothetical protein
MSECPEQCKAPANVWFTSREVAERNVTRKATQLEERWFVWRCYDHFHVKPKKNQRLIPDPNRATINGPREDGEQ